MHEGEIRRILGSLGREPPPDLPVEAILERWDQRRRRSFAWGSLGLAAGLLALVLLQPARHDEAAPVYLDLRVVDVTAEEASDADLSTWSPAPLELSQP